MKDLKGKVNKEINSEGKHRNEKGKKSYRRWKCEESLEILKQVEIRKRRKKVAGTRRKSEK